MSTRRTSKRERDGLPLCTIESHRREGKTPRLDLFFVDLDLSASLARTSLPGCFSFSLLLSTRFFQTEAPAGASRGRRSREVDLPATTRPGRPIRASHLCKRDGGDRARQRRTSDNDEDGVRRGAPRTSREILRSIRQGGCCPGAMPRSHGGTYPLIHFNLNRGGHSLLAQNRTSTAAGTTGSRAPNPSHVDSQSCPTNARPFQHNAEYPARSFIYLHRLTTSPLTNLSLYWEIFL